MLIDNFNQYINFIKLRFQEIDINDDMPYFLIILVYRSKDYNITNFIHKKYKTYYIFSEDDITEDLINEIKILCNDFGLRAYGSVNYKLIKRTTSFVKDNIGKNNKSISELFEQFSDITEASINDIFLFDIDAKISQDNLNKITSFIESLHPEESKKVIDILPTKAGYHIISRKFDLKKFEDNFKYLNLDIPIILKMFEVCTLIYMNI